jgi:levansucrase
MILASPSSSSTTPSSERPSQPAARLSRAVPACTKLAAAAGIAALAGHAAPLAAQSTLPQTSSWTAEQVRRITRSDTNTIPNVTAPRDQLMPGYWIWDSWPLRNRDGSIARINGWMVWMSLTAPDTLLPGQRHDVARIRYLASRDGVEWKPMGLVFPEEGAFGSRNWASDAIYLPEKQQIVVLYTATGDAAENCRASGERSVCDRPITYEQRIAWARGSVQATEEGPRFTGWQHKLLLEPDGRLYQSPEQTGGQLYAFRDPFYYVDPADGREYILFEANTAAPGRTGGNPSPGSGGGGSGSGAAGGTPGTNGTSTAGTGGGSGSGAAASTSGSGIGTGSGSPGGPLSGAPIGVVEYNGAIGIAEAVGNNENLDQWRMLPPLLTANAVNQELERPHLVNRDGRYYLFLDTHIGKFAPGLPPGPEGLYGFVAERLFGPYAPLNGSGLVLGNPDNERNRFQSYSWFVLPDFSVTSFLDTFDLPPGVNLGNLPERPAAFQKERFGGTYMPLWHLAVEGANTEVVVTDVNRDGLTTFADVTFAMNFTGTRAGDANYSRWMDMNRDGRVNMLDVNFIARYALPDTPDQVAQGLQVPVSRPISASAALKSPPSFKGRPKISAPAVE